MPLCFVGRTLTSNVHFVKRVNQSKECSSLAMKPRRLQMQKQAPDDSPRRSNPFAQLKMSSDVYATLQRANLDINKVLN